MDHRFLYEFPCRDRIECHAQVAKWGLTIRPISLLEAWLSFSRPAASIGSAGTTEFGLKPPLRRIASPALTGL